MTKKQQKKENADLFKEFQKKGGVVKLIPCIYKRWSDSPRTPVKVKGFQ